ncbi:tRNA pseudouridine(55) synthase [Propionibacterium sp. oral taxon 192 str. F0372]|uniref:tRNA pseudouridine(55) synthase TruB n=1 Tax=Propionibacterium sp. oral taxon 192 TaxID=671222 RepID=UPI000352B58E|nr:tRNA pseudouridine(55) synthase TruB [Propionibacterium sp. oral taxon 192]EPH00276.1 tRNA pseudouridine(55) synthase [Propionibacterium sp. oral taxon 192 str. F0372]
MTPVGVLVVDKPQGVTSHQVVGRIRKIFGTRKVGHAGTLDPMATGVLIVGIGRATRLLGYLALYDKAYTATIRLGATTTTDDAEGEILETRVADGLDHDAVEQVMAGLRGAIEQRPSSVSAIKVNGKRAHALVRAGEQVQLPPRPVMVSRFEVTSSRTDAGFLDLDVEVECSSGTYVRALARDLGEQLGVGGHLTSLRRTRIGGYPVDEAIALDAIEATTTPMTMDQVARASFPVCVVNDVDADHVRHGRRLSFEVVADPTGVLSADGELLGLYRPDNGTSKAVSVLVG